MSVNQRIKILIESLGFDSVRSFAKKVGYDQPQKIHRLLNNDDNKPSYDILRDIANAFPKVSIEWLVAGRGEMFRAVSDDFQVASDRIAHIMVLHNINIGEFCQMTGMNPEVVQQSISQGEGILREHHLIKILEAFPDVSPRWLITGKGRAIRESRPSNKFDINVEGIGPITITIGRK